jgi:O-antigen/teichoic acid export membrane protein
MKFETLRNGLANMLAGALPIFIVIFTTPYVVNTLGAEHYGLLTLITAIIGYFAIIDINFTAGSLKYVSEFHASGQANKRDQTLTAGFLLYLLIGVVGGGLIFGLADWLVTHVFAVPENAHALAASALRLAALGFLLGQVQSYLTTVPQALRRYDQSAMLESIFGMLAPLANVLVLWLGGGLYEIVLVRIVLSIVNLVALGGLIHRLLPDSRFIKPTRAILAPLASFSGFAYLNRLASLAYAQGDKLIIGALVGMSALTYYAVPFMLANRVYGLSYRLSSVMLPAASSLAATNQHDRMQDLYLYSARYVFFINCVLTLLLVSVAHEILLYWISPEMAAAGSLILVLIALGNLLDSLTNAPSLVNDGLGKPKITGMFAISRAVLGLSAVFVLVQWLGVVGAAIGQLAVSIVVPAAFLIYVHGRTVPVRLSQYLKVVVVPGLPFMGAMVLFAVLRHGSAAFSLGQTAVLICIELIATALYGWFFIARPSDLAALFARLKAARLAKGST